MGFFKSVKKMLKSASDAYDFIPNPYLMDEGKERDRLLNDPVFMKKFEESVAKALRGK